MTLREIAELKGLPLANIKGQFESLRRFDFDVPGFSVEERERLSKKTFTVSP